MPTLQMEKLRLGGYAGALFAPSDSFFGWLAALGG